MNEIFLDTETTGLSFKDGHRIVEIACIETRFNCNWKCISSINKSREKCPRRSF